MYGAFQDYAFQSYAYQTASSDGLLGGGGDDKKYHYHSPYYSVREQEYRQQKIAAARVELQSVSKEIARAQSLKEELLSLKNQQIISNLELEVLELQINALSIQQAQLIRLIDDEECILVILLSLPFIH